MGHSALKVWSILIEHHINQVKMTIHTLIQESVYWVILGKPVCTRGNCQALCKLKPLEKIMLPYHVRSSYESYTSPLSLADTFVPWGCSVTYQTESRFWQKPRELKIIFEIVPIISYPKTSLPVTGYQYPFCRLIHLVCSIFGQSTQHAW